MRVGCLHFRVVVYACCERARLSVAVYKFVSIRFQNSNPKSKVVTFILYFVVKSWCQSDQFTEV